MNRSPEQIEAFKKRLRQGLAGCWTPSDRDRRRLNLWMWSRHNEEFPPEKEPTAPAYVDLPTELKQVKAQVNYLLNKVTELRANKKRDNGAF